MNTVLLTWNPGPFDEHVFTYDTWLDDMVVPTRGGATLTGTWSVARHVNNIEPGDTAFMLRQGEWGRGVVARGVIRTFPWEGEHWNDSKAGRTTNYVDVEWTEAVPLELALEIENLEQLVPDFAWHQVFSSGRAMTERQGARLSVAWSRYLATDYFQTYSDLYVSDVYRNVVSLASAYEESE